MPLDQYGYECAPRRCRSTKHAGRCDDVGWFYEDRQGFTVHIQTESEGVISVRIPMKSVLSLARRADKSPNGGAS